MNFELFYETSGVCTDTRNIEKDCLFICLKGANFNGNTFAQQALDAGAKYVVVDEAEFATNDSLFLVEDCLIYLQQLANHHRKKFDIPVLGITGSNGKTSTKELVSTVLSKKYNVLFTQGNLNNHIGVPLTLLRLTKEHSFAVIEMGANKFKDIEELCLIAEPNYGIITNIGKAHLEGFLDFEGVLKTKKELYEAVEQVNGTLFYNGDDPILSKHVPKNIQHISFGINDQNDLIGELIGLNPFVSLRWKKADFRSDAIETKMIGKYNFYNFLAAICIGNYFDVSQELISDAIQSYTPSNNRSQIHKTDRNTLILDAYNANPSSMRSALESFAQTENKDKIAILGDMFELGEESVAEHLTIIQLCQELKLHTFFVGKRFKSLENESPYEHFEDKESFIEFTKTTDLSNKLILLKGSRGVGLESLVPFL